jgi:hypothetical protein
MSVSTTKSQSNTPSEQNDINDPVVQDVLNEFRDELQSSKNMDVNANSPHSMHINPNQIPIASHNIPHPLINNPNYFSQGGQASHVGPTGPLGHAGPVGASGIYQPYMQQHHNNLQANKNDYSAYIDVELIKKNVIIVLIVFLIYHSGIINNIYEKIPDYLQDNLTVFDVYIKTTIIFIVLYTISYLGYV